MTVIIPTFNRKSALLRCLEHLEKQTSRDFEASIVDDGSTDGTAELVEQYRAKASFTIHYHRQSNSGPAKARNWAIRNTRTELSVLIGDDIFAAPTFVERHITFHREHPEEYVVGLGLTKWCEDGQTVTPFMHWLSSDGIQFQYASLLGGEKPGWRHFYTSNLSFKTRYLQAHPFDESFRFAAYEDIELGLRLERQHGMDLYFLPEAVAEHLHPMNYLGSCRRMLMAGDSAYVFKQLCPDYREFEPLSPVKQRLFTVAGNPIVLGAVARVAAVLTHFWCPNPLTKPVLWFHTRVGFERARKQASAGKA